MNQRVQQFACLVALAAFLGIALPGCAGPAGEDSGYTQEDFAPRPPPPGFGPGGGPAAAPPANPGPNPGGGAPETTGE